jgi:hypothetical protein
MKNPDKKSFVKSARRDQSGIALAGGRSNANLDPHLLIPELSRLKNGE